MKKKKKIPKPSATTLDLIPFRQIDQVGRILTADENIVDIFQLLPRNIRVQNPDEQDISIYNYALFLRGYSSEMKIITMNYPAQTNGQIRYLQSVLERTDNEQYRYFLNQKIEELELISDTVADREYYIMIFAENESTYHKNVTDLNNLLSRVMNVSPISTDKKIQILRRLGSVDSRIM